MLLLLVMQGILQKLGRQFSYLNKEKYKNKKLPRMNEEHLCLNRESMLSRLVLCGTNETGHEDSLWSGNTSK